MRRVNLGCLLGILGVTLIIVIVMLGAAYVILNWRDGGDGGAANLWRLPIPTPHLEALPLPTWSPFRLPTPLSPSTSATPLPYMATPAATIVVPKSTPASPDASHGPIVLEDPSLMELSSRLSRVQSGQMVYITMSEQMLQRELQATLAGVSREGYEFRSVRMSPNTVTITGRARIDRMVVDVEISAIGYARDCWPVIQVTEVKLGRFAAPPFVVRQIQTYIDQWSDAYRNTGLACVSELRITDNQMILVGQIH